MFHPTRQWGSIHQPESANEKMISGFSAIPGSFFFFFAVDGSVNLWIAFLLPDASRSSVSIHQRWINRQFIPRDELEFIWFISFHDDSFVQSINNRQQEIGADVPDGSALDIDICKWGGRKWGRRRGERLSLERKGRGRRRWEERRMAESGRNDGWWGRWGTASGRQEVRMDEAHGGSLVDPGVFLQVIPAPEALGADGAGEGTQSGVDAFVARQFLVACESLPAGFFLAFKRPFTWFQ